MARYLKSEEEDDEDEDSRKEQGRPEDDEDVPAAGPTPEPTPERPQGPSEKNLKALPSEHDKVFEAAVNVIIERQLKADAEESAKVPSLLNRLGPQAPVRSSGLAESRSQ